MRYIFKSMGLSDRDVTIVQIGDNPSRIGGDKSNAIQAIGLHTPNRCGRGRPVSVPIVDAYKLGLKFHGSGIAASRRIPAGPPPHGGTVY